MRKRADRKPWHPCRLCGTLVQPRAHVCRDCRPQLQREKRRRVTEARAAAEGRPVPKVCLDAKYSIGEYRWLRGTDTPENIVRRLGYQRVESFIRVLDRNGEAKLAAELDWQMGGTKRARVCG